MYLCVIYVLLRPVPVIGHSLYAIVSESMLKKINNRHLYQKISSGNEFQKTLYGLNSSLLNVSLLHVLNAPRL